MTSERETKDPRPCVLLLDADVLVRHLIAEYLRGCGYRVAEAASSDEAVAILVHGTVQVDTLLMDMDASGEKRGFALLRHLRQAFPDVDIIPAGSPAKATEEAADLCEQGPSLARPYDPRHVLDEIKRLAARRDRTRAADKVAGEV